MASPDRHNSTLSTPDENLTPVQLQVIQTLAAGRTISAAARLAGIHRSTVYNWLNDQLVFREAFTVARDEYRDDFTDELRDLAGNAYQTLQDLLSNPETPPSVRLRTALAILDRPSCPEATRPLPPGDKMDIRTP